jgi:type I restriction enzyme M protein
MATVNLGFENNLWEMADKLRGNIEASEYKHVVLGLIFLKYISDAFEERYNELVAEGEGFEEDIDAYTEVNVFLRTKRSPLGLYKSKCKAANDWTDY